MKIYGELRRNKLRIASSTTCPILHNYTFDYKTSAWQTSPKKKRRQLMLLPKSKS